MTQSNGTACHCSGPGYATPLDAKNSGSVEKLLYVPAVVPDHSRPDYVATIDVDPDSKTFSQVIHRTPLGVGVEPHHSGWNACASCHSDASKSRSLLILPTLGKSPSVFALDVKTDPRKPSLKHVVTAAEIKEKTGLAYLHTSHCLGTGEILISAMGDEEGNPKGGFLVLNEDLSVKGTWSKETLPFGYDFWYQPRHNVMISTAWGAPSSFSKGFNPADVEAGKYGSSLYVWDWTEKKLVQEIPLGAEGLVPLEVRFLHDPSSKHGFVGAALSSNVIHFTQQDIKWVASAVIKQPWAKVEGWVLPELPPLITDILISLDDKYIFFSNWLRGDVVQYDISDPQNPKLAGRIFLGGVARKGGAVKITDGLPEDVGSELPEIPTIQGKELQGGPQMLQLSLDGKRLYVTNSLYSVWDNQFYPDLAKKGSYLLRLNVDSEKGGLSLDETFFIDFGAEPGGPVLAHEVRYPGGDCSSDIWL